MGCLSIRYISSPLEDLTHKTLQEEMGHCSLPLKVTRSPVPSSLSDSYPPCEETLQPQPSVTVMLCQVTGLVDNSLDYETTSLCQSGAAFSGILSLPDPQKPALPSQRTEFADAMAPQTKVNFQGSCGNNTYTIIQ